MEWPKFYTSMANAMRHQSGTTLYHLVAQLAEHNPALHYFHFENASYWEERGFALDPFSVIAIFNRGQTDAHRAEIGSIIAQMLNVDIAPPASYHGIPYLDPRHSIYDGQHEMMALFKAALNGPDPDFANAWDKAIAIRGNALGTLSIGLFWICPDYFMAIDKISAPFISQHFGIAQPQDKCTGSAYCQYLASLKQATPTLSWPDLTYQAWQQHHQ